MLRKKSKPVLVIAARKMLGGLEVIFIILSFFHNDDKQIGEGCQNWTVSQSAILAVK